MMALVSVALPVFNSERFLRPAIDSIRSQTHQEWELFLVYDPCRDQSLAICRQYEALDSRIHVIENKTGQGLSRCLNQAIEQAKGLYVARMDSDDISLPRRLELQVATMESHADVVALGCDIQIINERGEIAGERTYFYQDSQMRRQIYFFSPFCHPAIMYRKSALDQVGGYDTSYRQGEDYDLYFRLGALGKFMNLPQFLFQYRLVASSATHQNTAEIERVTIGIREKYKNAPGFHMGWGAALYNQVHRLSLILLSPTFRTRMFYFLRNRPWNRPWTRVLNGRGESLK
ncbi:MAG: hypothetical protein C5B49_12960 [Bdellovibrio sp.]|nr:MAG: hypothetical protein C5B49_12960 [Bdellovibrio sp.]